MGNNLMIKYELINVLILFYISKQDDSNKNTYKNQRSFNTFSSIELRLNIFSALRTLLILLFGLFFIFYNHFELYSISLCFRNTLFDFSPKSACKRIVFIRKFKFKIVKAYVRNS